MSEMAMSEMVMMLEGKGGGGGGVKATDEVYMRLHVAKAAAYLTPAKGKYVMPKHSKFKAKAVVKPKVETEERHTMEAEQADSYAEASHDDHHCQSMAAAAAAHQRSLPSFGKFLDAEFALAWPHCHQHANT